MILTGIKQRAASNGGFSMSGFLTEMIGLYQLTKLQCGEKCNVTVTQGNALESSYSFSISISFIIYNIYSADI